MIAGTFLGLLSPSLVEDVAQEVIDLTMHDWWRYDYIVFSDQALYFNNTQVLWEEGE